MSSYDEALMSSLESDKNYEENDQNDSLLWYSHVDENMWHQLCRICAKNSDYLIPIHENDGIEEELGVKMSTFFPFEISESDNLPKNCCHMCVSMIVGWKDFILSSVSANEKLNCMLNSTTSNSHEENDVQEGCHISKEGTDPIKSNDVHINDSFVDDENKTGIEACYDDSISITLNDSSLSEQDKHKDVSNKSAPTEITKDPFSSNLSYSCTEIYSKEGISQSDHKQKTTENKKNNNIEHDSSIFDLRIDDDHITTVYREPNYNDVMQKNKNEKASKYKEDVVDLELQAYKFHMPVKYVTINGHQFLRTKVFGFELANIPQNGKDAKSLFFICCLCNNIVKDINVISHSKSHYPLKTTDSCKICHFGFSSVDCFRLHLKKHICFIDEEYKRPVIGEESVKEVEKVSKPHAIDPGEITKPLNKLSTEGDRSHLPQDNGVFRWSRKWITPSERGNLDKFICEYCGKIFELRRKFLQHVRRAHISRFFCNTCKKRFSTKISSMNHKCVKVVPRKPGKRTKLLNCRCKKIFVIEEQYLEHVKTCKMAKYLPCKECGREFADEDKLHSHFLRQHIEANELNQTKSTVWVCEICGCVLSAVSAKKHYATHSFTEKKFVCSICEMKFITKSGLEKHIESHSNVRPFVCSTCGKTFKRKDHLKKHMENKHNVEEDRKYGCKKCGRCFMTEYFLLRHQRLHSKGVSYECVVCKSRYPTEQSLKMHQTKTKHDNGRGPEGSTISMSSADWANRHKCRTCGRRYGSVSSLRKHIFLHHQKVSGIKEESKTDEVEGDGAENKTLDGGNKNEIVENVYECSKCSKRFLSNFGLKLHLSRSKHGPVTISSKKKRKLEGLLSEKNPRFKCSKCNEMFSTLLSLKMHRLKRQHFSKCTDCDKKFVLDFKLRDHLMKVHHKKHMDEKVEYTQDEYTPYQCTFCKQYFAMKHNLITHLQKKHQGEQEPVSSDVVYIEADIYEQETADGETPVIYHCTDCWANFFTEEDFQNHVHEPTDDVTPKEESEHNVEANIVETDIIKVELSESTPVIAHIINE